MNVQNVNNKKIIVPTQLSDIEQLKNMKEQYLIVDFIDENPHVAIIGCLLELERNGKDVIVMYHDNFIGGIMNFINTIKI